MWRRADAYLRLEIEHRRDVANESAEAHEGAIDQGSEIPRGWKICSTRRSLGLREPMTLADARRVRDQERVDGEPEVTLLIPRYAHARSGRAFKGTDASRAGLVVD